MLYGVSDSPQLPTVTFIAEQEKKESKENGTQLNFLFGLFSISHFSIRFHCPTPNKLSTRFHPENDFNWNSSERKESFPFPSREIILVPRFSSPHLCLDKIKIHSLSIIVCPSKKINWFSTPSPVALWKPPPQLNGDEIMMMASLITQFLHFVTHYYWSAINEVGAAWNVKWRESG